MRLRCVSSLRRPDRRYYGNSRASMEMVTMHELSRLNHDRRGVAYDRLLAYQHRFDPAERCSPYTLLVNRMSPSAYRRGHAQAIFYTLHYLAYLKELGANVVNGYDAYVYEFSNARQLSLLHRLGLRSPRTRVINDASQAVAAAA